MFVVMPSKLSLPTEPAYFVHESSVHGRGLYAARDVKKGERILEYLGEKVTKKESERRATELVEKAKETGGGAVYMFILNQTHDIDGNVDYNDARLMNHTCEPNCEAHIVRGRIWYVATKDIPQGTELGLNYGFALENWEDHPCRCGTQSCIGYIVAEEYWPKLRRQLAKAEAMKKHRKLLRIKNKGKKG
jgi:SET domain-containing protein